MQRGIKACCSLSEVSARRQVEITRYAAKSDMEFVWLSRRRIQPNRFSGGIVAGKLARRFYP